MRGPRTKKTHRDVGISFILERHRVVQAYSTFLRDVTSGGTGTNVVAPKFSDTLAMN